MREQSSRFSETTRTRKNDIRAENAESHWIAAVSAAEEILSRKEHKEHKEYLKLCELCVRL